MRLRRCISTVCDRVGRHAPRRWTETLQQRTSRPQCLISNVKFLRSFHTSTELRATRKRKVAADSETATKTKPEDDNEPEKLSALKKKVLEYLQDEWTEAEADSLEVVASQLREAAFFDLPKVSRSKKSEDYDDSVDIAALSVDEDGNPTMPARKTYLGGLPLASSTDYKWPTHTIKLENGRESTFPLEFIFQMDMSEVARNKFAAKDQAGIPDSGLLQFFAMNLNWFSESNKDKLDAPITLEAGQSSWITHVRHIPVATDASPRMPPKDLDFSIRIHDRMELAPRVGISMRPKLLLAKTLTVEEGGHTPFEYESVMDLVEAKHSTTAQQFLGMPQSLNNLVEFDAAGASASAADALKWRCLLQITSDSETGVFSTDDPDARMWFMIKEEDLRAGKWDKVVGVHQK